MIHLVERFLEKQTVSLPEKIGIVKRYHSKMSSSNLDFCLCSLCWVYSIPHSHSDHYHCCCRTTDNIRYSKIGFCCAFFGIGIHARARVTSRAFSWLQSCTVAVMCMFEGGPRKEIPQECLDRCESRASNGW